MRMLTGKSSVSEVANEKGSILVDVRVQLWCYGHGGVDFSFPKLYISVDS